VAAETNTESFSTINDYLMEPQQKLGLVNFYTTLAVEGQILIAKAGILVKFIVFLRKKWKNM